jgi:hypothetical protein
MSTDNVTTTHTTVPAAPGWFVALLVESDTGGPAYFDEHPILAWDIVRREYLKVDDDDGERVFHEVKPITLDLELIDLANEWAVKRPDGQYCIFGDAEWQEKSFTIQRLRARQARAAKPPTPPPPTAPGAA